MRKITLITLVLVLNGCALIDAYRMSRFDNNEYMLVNRVRTQASIAVDLCESPKIKQSVDKVYASSLELKNYSASIPENQETIKMTAELVEIAKGLNERYDNSDDVSPAYCKVKFKSIENNASTIQKVIGAKPR